MNMPDITGPKVYLRITEWWNKFSDNELVAQIFSNPITQTTISLLAVTIILISIALIGGRNLKKRPGRLQVVTEKLVNMLYGMVRDTMGEHNLKFAPYIGTIFLCSIIGSLIGMTGIFRSTTADLSVTMAWALVTTGMVWYNNIKNFGFKAWLKGFTEPIAVMTPMNIIGEIANPLSMAFRHFGNVAGGSVLTTLIYWALAAGSQGLLQLIFSWLPAQVVALFPPVLQAGIPAFLSIYFDLFSGFVQALVFSLLTMVYVAGACPPYEELPEKTQKKIDAKRAKEKAE